jgi:hypothetical protein
MVIINIFFIIMAAAIHAFHYKNMQEGTKKNN